MLCWNAKQGNVDQVLAVLRISRKMPLKGPRLLERTRKICVVFGLILLSTKLGFCKKHDLNGAHIRVTGYNVSISFIKYMLTIERNGTAVFIWNERKILIRP